MNEYSDMTGVAITVAVDGYYDNLPERVQRRGHVGLSGDIELVTIIQHENKISLLWDENILGWVAKGTPEHPQHGPLEPVSDWGADPLRCICIVFLMMQEAIKELDK